MISLYIDTATSYPIISLIKDNEIIYLYKDKIDGDISVSIFSIIETGFKKANISAKDVDNIYVVNGPGSFTGTRIGVTIAKVFAWSLDKKVVPLSTLMTYATTKTDRKKVLSIIDARHNHAYAGLYDSDLNVIVKDNYMSLDDIKAMINDDVCVVSNDEFDFETIKPEVDIIRIINSNHDFVNPHSLNPNYCKLTEAEEKRRNG